MWHSQNLLVVTMQDLVETSNIFSLLIAVGFCLNGLLKVIDHEFRELEQSRTLRGSMAALRNPGQPDHRCFQMFAKVRKGWHVATSIGNIIPMLMAMFENRKTSENDISDHF